MAIGTPIPGEHYNDVVEQVHDPVSDGDGVLRGWSRSELATDRSERLRICRFTAFASDVELEL
ncbi:hypothetical protein FRC12_010956 [Ceratobasidium sp. 428]|nr:hypothetical protein FRC12_010956 [Ceratobasidium sp. 428]